MAPENALHIKLAWVELSAVGTFTIATVATLCVIYFAVRALRR